MKELGHDLLSGLTNNLAWFGIWLVSLPSWSIVSKKEEISENYLPRTDSYESTNLVCTHLLFISRASSELLREFGKVKYLMILFSMIELRKLLDRYSISEPWKWKTKWEWSIRKRLLFVYFIKSDKCETYEQDHNSLMSFYTNMTC